MHFTGHKFLGVVMLAALAACSTAASQPGYQALELALAEKGFTDIQSRCLMGAFAEEYQDSDLLRAASAVRESDDTSWTGVAGVVIANQIIGRVTQGSDAEVELSDQQTQMIAIQSASVMIDIAKCNQAFN